MVQNSYSQLEFTAAVSEGVALVMLVCRDGRLCEGDRLLAVDGHLLGEKSSLEDAVHWLQAAAGRVTLIVAHKTDTTHPPEYNSLLLDSSSPTAVSHLYSLLLLLRRNLMFFLPLFSATCCLQCFQIFYATTTVRTNFWPHTVVSLLSVVSWQKHFIFHMLPPCMQY